MIYLSYVFSELRRRRGRTILTALGLGVGVGLVLAVNALSAGLDRAQAEVLEPLVGVGTDMSANRPLTVSGDPRTAFQNLSPAERSQLRQELGGGGRIDFSKLTPGSTFTQTVYRSSQLSFAAAKVEEIAAADGVGAAAGGLTLDVSTISGTVPNASQLQDSQRGGFGPPGDGGGGPPVGAGNASFASTSISGVDPAEPAIGAITAGQVTAGTYLTSGTKRQALLDVAYAKTKAKAVGDTIALGKERYDVIGLVRTPLGGQASDVYVSLGNLQRMSDRNGRVNVVYVRAAEASAVPAVADEISAIVPGASVTTAETLAGRVSGSLTSAQDLTQKLGFALELVGLVGAILIASLLTLSSVGKRVREFGTLRAVGWSRWLVVRQVSTESLFQGLLGAVFGIAIGIGAVGLISLFAPTLEATVSSATESQGFPGPFGQGAVSAAASETVELSARLSPSVVLVAAVLAVVAGLVAGAAGALRASRLQPVEALRNID